MRSYSRTMQLPSCWIYTHGQLTYSPLYRHRLARAGWNFLACGIDLVLGVSKPAAAAVQPSPLATVRRRLRPHPGDLDFAADMDG